jgi:hypothetical protein
MKRGPTSIAKMIDAAQLPKIHRASYENDVGIPGPPPAGTGRASFPVPRLSAPRYLVGERVTVTLPGTAGDDVWVAEIFGVQLPLMPSNPASVRVLVVERLERKRRAVP